MADRGEKQVIYHPAQVNDFSMWAIGRGWEGTTADWTDYFFVMLGFLSLIFWMHQRNPNYIDEERLLDEVRGETDAAEDGDASTEAGEDGGISSQSTGARAGEGGEEIEGKVGKVDVRSGEEKEEVVRKRK